MLGAKQLKMQPEDQELIASGDYRYYIVKTVESPDGRSMSLLSMCDMEGEARQAAATLFQDIKDQYQDVTFGVGIVDSQNPDYMLACRFAYGKPAKK